MELFFLEFLFFFIAVMGREGGQQREIAKTKDEIDNLLASHNKSERQKKKTVVADICDNKDDATKLANFELGKNYIEVVKMGF